MSIYYEIENKLKFETIKHLYLKDINVTLSTYLFDWDSGYKWHCEQLILLRAYHITKHEWAVVDNFNILFTDLFGYDESTWPSYTEAKNKKKNKKNRKGNHKFCVAKLISHFLNMVNAQYSNALLFHHFLW